MNSEMRKSQNLLSNRLGHISFVPQGVQLQVLKTSLLPFFTTFRATDQESHLQGLSCLELELLNAVWGAAHKNASLVRGPGCLVLSINLIHFGNV